MTNIIILFCSILAGFLIGKHFEKRELLKGQFLTDLSKYIILLKANVNSRRDDLSAFNSEFCKTSSDVFKKYLECNCELYFLTQAQRSLVQAFFESLCTTSSIQLLNNLDYYGQLVNAELMSVGNAVRNRTVSVKLGVLMGVMVGILLM